MNPSISIAFAQLNFFVGDISGNVMKMIAAAQRAKQEKSAQLIIFSELSVTGYPPEDLLYRSDFLDAVEQGIADLEYASKDIAIIAGAPRRIDGKLYNAALYFNDGKLAAQYNKILLPNYAVFDEMRYFSPGDQPGVIQLADVRIGITICEDIWEPQPVSAVHAAGADIIININASPFHIGKQQQRIAVLKQRVAEVGIPIIYVNQLGGQDELVFDGASSIVAANGDILFVAPEFEEGIYSCRVTKEGTNTELQCSETSTSALEFEALIWRALCLGIKDYLGKNSFAGAVIGLSGGIDSAVTLMLAIEALGAKNVTAVMMPSRYTSSASIEDARTLATSCGVQFHEIAIDKNFDTFLNQLVPVFLGAAADVTEENIQARIRAILLMAISNKFNLALLATGNKSEMAVGYSTLYGDMAGAFAPLKDVVKTLVYRLALFCNRDHQHIPQRILERPPSAELAPQQTDQDSLPPYEELDLILQQFVEMNVSGEKILKQGFALDTVKKVQHLIMRYEYKRRQSPLGIKITQNAFGRDWRYPISSKYKF